MNCKSTKQTLEVRGERFSFECAEIAGQSQSFIRVLHIREVQYLTQYDLYKINGWQLSESPTRIVIIGLNPHKKTALWVLKLHKDRAVLPK